ncbi:Serine/threonine-protein kinase PknD [Phycisphaerae bacterium RAS1]|nr:Serine/threonine-protein kinase PknD [Phycisphaerae bacterium RAS1]
MLAIFRATHLVLMVGLLSPYAAPQAARLGLFTHQRDELADPQGVAFKADGSILVCDATARVIRRLSPQLVPIAETPLAARPGTPMRPVGVAVDRDGRVYVSDAAADCVRVLDVDGAPLKIIGRRGRGDDELCDPAGIAVHGDHIFVADSGNHRIMRFLREGTAAAPIGRYGQAAGELNRPLGVALDGQGNIYVADTDNHRIQKFDAAGGFLKMWGDFGYFPGLLSEPSGIAFHAGQVYVADKLNHRIQVFSSDGDLVYEWGLHVFEPHEGRGKFHYPSALAIAEDGGLAAVAESFEDRVQLFGLSSGPTSDIPPLPPMEPGLSSHFGPPVSVGGKLLVLSEPESRKVLIYDYTQPTPIQIHNFGAFGCRLGQFSRISAVALDPGRDRLYVADIGNRRLCEFALSRGDGPLKFEPRMSRFVRAIDLADATLMQRGECTWPVEPSAMLVTAAGLVLLDARNARVLTLSRELELTQGWGRRGTAVGELWRPSGIAAGRDGEALFIADGELGRVGAFSTSGEFLYALQTPRDRVTGPVQPSGVAAGVDGCVYVTDAATHRVLKFSERGEFIKLWGSRGLGAGQFFKPGGVVQTAEGRVYVVDFGNHRVQCFDGEGNFTGVFGARLYAQAARRSAARP